MKEMTPAASVATGSMEEPELTTKWVLDLDLEFTGNDIAYLLSESGFTAYPETPGFDLIKKFMKEVAE